MKPPLPTARHAQRSRPAAQPAPSGQALLEVWRAAKVRGHQLVRPEQQKGGENQPIAAKRKGSENQPIAVKRKNGAKTGAANGRASAEKRQTAPQLPGGPCLHCGRDTAGRWIYPGKKVCGNCYVDKKCRLVKGVQRCCCC